MKKILPFLILALIMTFIPPGGSSANTSAIQLGSDVLFNQFHQIIEGKKVGLVTNQTGINSQGVSTIDMLRRDRSVKLTALFAPDHGLDGTLPAGAQGKTYIHPVYNIPVYSLYGSTRIPTKEMMENVDLLLVDIQDIGSRTDTSLSALASCMKAAKQQGKPIVVLDRPNPLGGTIVDGPVLEAAYQSINGTDTIPLAHGMTIGELALYFNRSIGVDLTVVPMQGYTRSMIYQDTGLAWPPTTRSTPTLTSVFSYMATGLAPETVLHAADDYSWIGGTGIPSYQLADLLNASGLPGVVFLPESKDAEGGVRLHINDPHRFNPAKTGIYAMAYARQLIHYPVPKSDKVIAKFDQLMGTNKIGALLEQEKSPQEIEATYAEALTRFRDLRKAYLIYGDQPFHPSQLMKSKPVGTQPAPKPAQPPQSGTGATTSTPSHPTPQPPAVKPPVTPAAPNPAKPGDKVAYLTFDDGPSPVTPHVLDTLKEFNVKATFFIVGRSIAGHEAILKRTVAEGHAIGGHTYSHDYTVLYKTVPGFFADLDKGNQLIEKATGIKPSVFRYPGGSTNTVSHKYQDPAQFSVQKPIMNAIKAEAAKRGEVFIDWNITNGDARTNRYTAAQALANIKYQVKNQKEIVILMHDSSTKSPTAQALPEVIKFLKEKGYRFDVIKPDHPTVSTVK